MLGQPAHLDPVAGDPAVLGPHPREVLLQDGEAEVGGDRDDVLGGGAVVGGRHDRAGQPEHRGREVAEPDLLGPDRDADGVTLGRALVARGRDRDGRGDRHAALRTRCRSSGCWCR